MEILPNELLLECFKYLDGLHIFHSFDELNQRFSILIRSIALFIDFENMTTENYYRIGMNIFSNAEIKKQIYSLKLANKHGYQRKLATTGHFTDGFVHLRSLSSKEMNRDSEPILHMNLSKLTELTCFHMKYNNDIIRENFATLPMSQLRVLTLSALNHFDSYWNILSSITNLTLHRSNNNNVHDLLTYAPNLKYLHIWLLTDDMITRRNQQIPTDVSKSLRSFTIASCWSDFSSLARILKRTVNLVSLTINRMITEKSSFINEWEYLIASSLPNLKTFDFCFTYCYGTTKDDMEEEYKELQKDFWLKEHQWYTNLELLRDNRPKIYTIPYKYYSYQFSSFLQMLSRTYFENMQIPEIYSDHKIDRRNMFTHVKSLECFLSVSTNLDRHELYFPSVTSLSIYNCCLDEQIFQWLRLTVNLENVNTLCISADCKLQQPDILLEFLKQSPNISSLSIHRETLLPLLNNEELCEYLSKMIKKLTLLEIQSERSTKPTWYKFVEEKLFQNNKFWKIFVNLEKLNCQITERHWIRYFFEYLPKLSNLEINCQKNEMTIASIEFAEQTAAKLGIEIIVEKERNYNNNNFIIWIIRNTDKMLEKSFLNKCFEYLDFFKFKIKD